LELNKIIKGDCLTELRKLPDNCINTIITSPPYNKGLYTKTGGPRWANARIDYGDFSDDLSPEEYITNQINVLNECVRVIKPDGSIFYNHKPITYNHSIIYPTYVFKFIVRQILIWDRGSSPQVEPIRFMPSTERIFWITKTRKTPKFYKNLLAPEYRKEIWKINAKPNMTHPAPFPVQIPLNCITATTDLNDLVLDPYSGIGSTAKAAKQIGRNYLGFEISQKYIDIANKRLEIVGGLNRW
jgi:modification methylase